MNKEKACTSPSRGLATYKKQIDLKRKILVLLVLVLFILTLISIHLGASSIKLHTVIEVLKDHFFKTGLVSKTQASIVMQVRLPRVFLAIVVGAVLSLAGLLMQGVFRNPLVSPYTLGVSNGASLGASLAIIFAYKFSFLELGRYLIPSVAFVFAMFTMVLVYSISKMVDHSSQTLILSGVAVGYLFSALVFALKYIADIKALPELVFWSMGSLVGRGWEVVTILFTVLLVSILVSMARSWDLNVMALGEEEAMALGINYRGVQIMCFVLSTVLTATAVSFTGVIGFVGLVAPHLTRMLIGDDHRFSIPGSVLLGSILLLLSDTVARNLFAPTEIPIGIVTSLIGVPFFLYLIMRRRRI